MQNVPGSTGGWLDRLKRKPAVGREVDEDPCWQTRDAEGLATVNTDGKLLILGHAVAQMVIRQVITVISLLQSHACPLEVEKVTLGWACSPIILVLLVHYLPSFHDHSAL